MGTAGQNLFFDGQSADSGVDAALIDPTGNDVFSVAAGNDYGPFTLGQSGVYTLTVSGNGAATGNYALSLLDTSSQPLAPTSTPTTVSGTITPGTGTAIYQILGTAGLQLVLTSDSFSSTAGSWSVYDPNNREVVGASFGSSFTATLPLTGPYTLVLEGSDTTDSAISYSFDISATAPASATSTGFDTPESGTLAAGASISFTFTARAGLPIYYNSIDQSFGPINIALVDPNGDTVFSNYYASSNEGPYVLSVPGSYTLTLTNVGGSSGTYDFNLMSLADSATPLTLGATQTVTGTLDAGTSAAVYSFAGVAGHGFFLDNEQNQGDPVSLLLIDPYNNTLLNIGSYSDGGPLTFTATGAYYLLVVGNASSSIGYQLRLTDTSYQPVTLGTSVSGTLGSPTAADVYTFSGSAGERVSFQAVSESNGSYGASWTLYGPNNQPVANASYWNNFSSTLPADGTYTLVVANSPSYGGASTYSFATVVNVDPTDELTLGKEVTGTIANLGDEHTYTFKGNVGQTLYFDGLTSDPGVYAYLYDPFGNQLFTGEPYYNGISQDEGPLTLPFTGTYTLTVYGGGYYGSYGYTGSYDFVLSDTSTAPGFQSTRL